MLSLLLLVCKISFLYVVCGYDNFNFECPKSAGKFTFSANCHKYYECKNNIANLKDCPDNQAFHEIWNTCVWQGYVEACVETNKEPLLCGASDETDRTDGRKATPWTVAVFQRDREDGDWEFISPGVILGPTTVLTTCRLGRKINGKWRSSTNASAFQVVAAAESLDEANQDEFSQTLKVSYIQINPKYNGKSYEFCNALIHLKDTIKLDTPYAKSICLPVFKSSSNTNKNAFGYRGTGILSNYAEKNTASDGFAHMESKTFRLTSLEYCFAHTFKKNTYCGVSLSGNDNLADMCMAHSTVSATKINSDPRWFLLGFGSHFNAGVCSIRNLDDDSKLTWISNGIRCGPMQFPCGNNKCISLDSVCNNQIDCPQGEDEDAKWCRAKNPCINDATFECGVYENCVEAKKVCDGYPDCYDASDEDPNTCKNVKKKNTVPFYASMLSESSTGAQTGESSPEVSPATSKPRLQPTHTTESDVDSVSDSHRLPVSSGTVMVNSNFGSNGKGFPTESEIQPRNSNNSKQKCPKLEVDEGTILKCSNPPGKVNQDCSAEEEVGTIATYQCKRFYKPGLTSGSTLTKKCFDDTHWKPERYFECVPDCGLVISTSNTYIVNGQNVNTKNRFPWHAAIFIKTKNKYEYICGGTLIHQSFVVTAAHCVTDINGDNNRLPDTYQIALAPSSSDFEKLKTDSNTQLFQVKKIQVNVHYDPLNNYQSDIALLELTKPGVLGIDVMLACLPRKDITDPSPGKIGKVVGFGYDEAGKITDVLKFANLPIATTEDCITKVNFVPSINQICAGYTNGTGVCFGDSGGGLVFLHNERYYLHGIVSVGPKVEVQRKRSLHLNCNHYTYSVFTSVPRFVDWIYDQINLLEMEL